MKKAIFTLGIITLSFAFANATTILTIDPNTDSNTEIINESGTVYAYTVVTENRVFNGTADTMKEARHMISKFNDSDIIRKSITPIALDTEDRDKIYVWGVSTNFGYASGTSDSLKDANKMIILMSVGDVLESKIVESFKPSK